MSGINVEMLKQLLQEFEEKETVITAEVKIVEQQISELENRAQSCQERLGAINADKSKLGEMTTRYSQSTGSKKEDVNGQKQRGLKIPPAEDLPKTNKSQTVVKSSSTVQAPIEKADKESTKIEATKSVEGEKTSPQPTRLNFQSSKNLASNNSEFIDEKTAKSVPAPSKGTTNKDAQEQEHNMPEQPEAIPQPQKPESTPESPEESGDDPVRSINDALRGLFQEESGSEKRKS